MAWWRMGSNVNLSIIPVFLSYFPCAWSEHSWIPSTRNAIITAAEAQGEPSSGDQALHLCAEPASVSSIGLIRPDGTSYNIPSSEH